MLVSLIAFLFATPLPAAATPPPPPAVSARKKGTEVAEKSADPRDKVICKRFIETGSLVKGYRTCQTKAEWDRQRDNARTSTSSAACAMAANGSGCR